MADGANIIRELLTRLGVVVPSADKKALADFDKRINQVKHGMEAAAGAALAMGAAFAGAVTAGLAFAGKLAIGVGQTATDIERQALALNLTTKEYQELLFVAESFGADAGDMADTFLQINQAVQDAATGGKSMVEQLANIGLKADDLKGMNPGQIFEAMADAASKTTDKAKALAAISTLLGEDSAKKFGPAMLMGADAIRTMRLEAEELGVVMSGDQLRASKASATAWRRLTTVAKGLRNELGALLAPIVTKIVEGMLRWVKANRELISQRMEDAVRRITGALEFLHALVRAVGGWDVVFLGVAQGVGLLLLVANLSRIEATLVSLRTLWTLFLQPAAMGVAAGMGVSLSGLVLILGGLVAAIALTILWVDDLRTHMAGGESVIGDVLAALERTVPGFASLRDLLAATRDFAREAWPEIGRLAKAFASSLVPSMESVRNWLAPLLEDFELLRDIWEEMTRVFGEFRASIPDPAGWLAGQFRAGAEKLRTDRAIREGGVAPGLFNQALSGVQGNLDRSVNSSSVDNRSSSSNVNLTNNFGGGTGQDAVNMFESALRLSRPSFQGGER